MGNVTKLLSFTLLLVGSYAWADDPEARGYDYSCGSCVTPQQFASFAARAAYNDRGLTSVSRYLAFAAGVSVRIRGANSQIAVVLLSFPASGASGSAGGGVSFGFTLPDSDIVNAVVQLLASSGVVAEFTFLSTVLEEQGTPDSKQSSSSQTSEEVAARQAAADQLAQYGVAHNFGVSIPVAIYTTADNYVVVETQDEGENTIFVYRKENNGNSDGDSGSAGTGYSSPITNRGEGCQRACSNR